MAKMIIIRGVSGSGKSTYARNVYPTLKCVEADQYFMDVEGNYNFDPKKLKDAHEYCYNATLRELKRGNDVVVANTFTTKWELDKYLNIRKFIRDVHIEVVEMHSQYENVHGVPADKIQMMKNRWETINWSELNIKVTIIN